jgi:hypothetical protein
MSRRGKRPISDAERFLRLVQPEPNGGCWLWIGAAKWSGTNNSHLRGTFSLDGKIHKAHRAAWIIFCGPITDGLHVCHRCDVPLCVNPEHLFLGTHAENIQDAGRKGRMTRARGEAHHNARLTASIVRAIRQADGGLDDLAAQFGVDRTTIHRIKTNRAWRHVT